jgi:hypothetical protein
LEASPNFHTAADLSLGDLSNSLRNVEVSAILTTRLVLDIARIENDKILRVKLIVAVSSPNLTACLVLDIARFENEESLPVTLILPVTSRKNAVQSFQGAAAALKSLETLRVEYHEYLTPATAEVAAIQVATIF